MKVVIDTNVWVSGLLWGGVPNQVLQLVRQASIQALMTEPLLQEVATTFTYARLQSRLQQIQETPTNLMLIVQELTQLCRPACLLRKSVTVSKRISTLGCGLY